MCAHQQMEEYECRVWVEHPQLGYAPGRVVEDDMGSSTIVVEACDGRVHRVSRGSCPPIHPNSLLGVPDLLELGEFSLAALLHNVRTRYEKGEYYSSIGLPILISVNPYRPLPHLYDTATRKRYQSAKFLLLSPPSKSPQPSPRTPLLFTDNPHLFGTAQMTYSSLMRNNQAQSIVVSGESGAGKTEATKILLRYFSELDDASQMTPRGAASPFSLLTPKIGNRLVNSSTTVKSAECNIEQIPIELHALRSNPILEAFGNAKTIRNDNSSRFGKFIQIYFDQKHRRRIRKALISHYLLEKCRLVSLHPGERNFHVFYALLYGATSPVWEAKLVEWGIYNRSDFHRMLGPFEETHAESEIFEELITCLNCTGFDSFEIDAIFRIIAALLHLSNLSFQQANSQLALYSADVPLASLKSNDSLNKAAELLGITKVPPQSNASTALEAFLHVFQWGRVRDASGFGSSIFTKRDHQGAAYIRDAIIKETYSRLFEWLVRKINMTLCSKEEAERRINGSSSHSAASKLMESLRIELGTKSGSTDMSHLGSGHLSRGQMPAATPPIGLLDIYGFEVFEGRNSFEQLCINYANEKLQQHFNHHVLSLEQKTYKDEGIDWSDITFTDNKHIIDALESRSDGVFSLLDSATLAPSANEDWFIRELEQARHKSVISIPQTFPRRLIIVRHYAGDVDYDVAGFVDKNKDKLSHECSYYFGAASTDPIMTQMYPPLPSAFNTRSNSLKATVSLEFRTQLAGLLTSLTSTTPTYVRCIKPNSVKAAHKFDSLDVLRQLKYAGLLESIRIRNSGFGVRCTFEELLDKYALLNNAVRQDWRSKRVSLDATAKARLCKELLHLIVPLNTEEVTTTTTLSLGAMPSNKIVSVKGHQGNEIAFKRLNLSYNRGASSHPGKRAWQTGQTRVFMKEEVQIHLEKCRAQVMSENIILIQACWRGRMTRLAYLRSREAIIRLQRSWRNRMALKRIRLVWRNNVAYIKIRRWLRWMVMKRRLRYARQSAIKIQRAWRRYAEIREQRLLQEEEQLEREEAAEASLVEYAEDTMQTGSPQAISNDERPSTGGHRQRGITLEDSGLCPTLDQSRHRAIERRRRRNTVIDGGPLTAQHLLTSSGSKKPEKRRERNSEIDLFNRERDHQRYIDSLRADNDLCRSRLEKAQKEIEKRKAELMKYKTEIQRRVEVEELLDRRIAEERLVNLKQEKTIEHLRHVYRTFATLVEELNALATDECWRQMASRCPDVDAFRTVVISCCTRVREKLCEADFYFRDPLTVYNDYYGYATMYPESVYGASTEYYLRSPQTAELFVPPVEHMRDSQPIYGTPSCTRWVNNPAGSVRCDRNPSVYEPMSDGYSAAGYQSASSARSRCGYSGQHVHGGGSSYDNPGAVADSDYLSHIMSNQANRRAAPPPPPPPDLQSSAGGSTTRLCHVSPNVPSWMQRMRTGSQRHGGGGGWPNPPLTGPGGGGGDAGAQLHHHERVFSCNVDNRYAYREAATSSQQRVAPAQPQQQQQNNSSDDGGLTTPYHHRACYARPPRSARPAPTHRSSSSLRLPRGTHSNATDETTVGGLGSTNSSNGSTAARSAQSPPNGRGPMVVQAKQCFGYLDGKSLLTTKADGSSRPSRCIQKGLHTRSPPEQLTCRHPMMGHTMPSVSSSGGCRSPSSSRNDYISSNSSSNSS